MAFPGMPGMPGLDPLGGQGVGRPPAGGGMPGMPGMGGPPGMGGADPSAELAMRAMGQLGAGQANPTAALQQVEQAYDLAHQLILGTIPQLQQFNPKAARDAHAAARTILSIRSAIRMESTPTTPPDLMLGMGMGGLPPAGPVAGAPAGGPGMGGF